MELEKKIADSIKRYSPDKSSNCPDETLLEFYLQGRLTKGEENFLVEHINKCAYCLMRITELRESLWLYEKSRKTFKVLPSLKTEKKLILAFALIMIVFSVLFFIKVNLKSSGIQSLLTVDVLTAEGKIVNQTKGVIINSEGLVILPLTTISGGEEIQINLPDGKTYRTSQIWKNEQKNIAIVKLNNSLKGLPLASAKDVHEGQKVKLISFRDGNLYDAIVTNAINLSSKRKEKLVYLNIMLLDSKPSEGLVINEKGEVVGITVAKEDRIVLTSFIEDTVKEVREYEPVSLKNLKIPRQTDKALYYYFKGILALDFNKTDQAMQYLKKAVEFDPYLEGPHLELAGIYYEKRLYELEMQEYLKVLQINPDNETAMFYLAMNYETQGMYDEAIRLYEKILRKNPEDPDTIFQLGLAYLTVGQKDKAKSLYPKLKSIDPGYGEKLRRLAGG